MKSDISGISVQFKVFDEALNESSTTFPESSFITKGKSSQQQISCISPLPILSILRHWYGAAIEVSNPYPVGQEYPLFSPSVYTFPI